MTGLTLRGRAFVAAGLATAVVAVVLGQRDVMRVAVLLVALPLLAAASVARTQYRLACSRRLDPPRVPVGRPTTVTVRVENASWLPTGVLLVEDTVPYQLGVRPRYVLDGVESRAVREAAYRARTDVRGRYTIGPLVVRLTDPFGLVEVTRSIPALDRLVVTPPVVALPPIRLGGDWSRGAGARARAAAVAGEDDASTREYRKGDDLRRVHWRSTARYGELMVRREEQPWQNRAALLLDTRASAHLGEVASATFEWAVTAAASIGCHLARRGLALRVVTSEGEVISGGSGEVGTGGLEDLLLDFLAGATPSRAPSLAAGTAALRSGPRDGLVVAVLGALEREDAQRLALLRRSGTECIGLVAHPASWSPSGRVPGAARPRASFLGAQRSPRLRPGPRPPAPADGPPRSREELRLLSEAGWRVIEAGAGDRLADCWSRADDPAIAVVLQSRP